MKSEYVIPIFIPYIDNKSKDNIFFNRGLITNEKKMITVDVLKEKIEYSLKNIKENSSYKEVAFFGESFPKLDINLQEELLKVVYEYIKQNKVKSIRIYSEPNYINKTVLKLLKKYKVKTIEISAPSTNDYILQKSNLNYTFKDIVRVSKMIKWSRFKLGYQMMVGMPDSTKNDEINTAKDLIKFNPKIIRIYPVVVVKETKLEKDFNNGEYIPPTLVQAIETCKELVGIVNSKKIEAIKIGLENIFGEIQNAKNIIGGPYHPDFGLLVESALWYDSIVAKIKKLNVKVQEVEVTVNPIDIANVIGYKKENAIKLKDLYDVDLVVKQNEKIKQGKSKIEIIKTYTDFE